MMYTVYQNNPRHCASPRHSVDLKQHLKKTAAMLRRCCLLFYGCGRAAAAPCLSGTAGAEPRCVLPYTLEIFWKTQQQLFLEPRPLRAAAPWWTRPNPQNPAPPNPSHGQMLIMPEWLLTRPRTLTTIPIECCVGVGCCRSYVHDHALDREVM